MRVQGSGFRVEGFRVSRTQRTPFFRVWVPIYMYIYIYIYHTYIYIDIYIYKPL